MVSLGTNLLARARSIRSSRRETNESSNVNENNDNSSNLSLTENRNNSRNNVAFYARLRGQRLSSRRSDNDSENDETFHINSSDSMDSDQNNENSNERSNDGNSNRLEQTIENRRLNTHKSASGMSQTDLRATIREISLDQTLKPGERQKKIQELMEFSFRKNQQVELEKKNSMRKHRSTSSMRSRERKKSSSSIKNGIVTDASDNLARSASVFVSGAVGRNPNRNNSMASEISMTGIDYESVSEEDTDDEDYYISYHDEANEVLGCKHYPRKCMVSAPCCDEFFCCRFCHDEFCDHEIVRQDINRVRCMACAHIQPFSSNCEKCGIQFGRYHCDKCKFFDDTEGKHIYHCDKCNICRIGEGLGIDYFHCDRCNACMSITLKDHKCVERSLESDCPVCSEYLFTSTTPVMFLPCGHCIHVACYEEYTQTNFTCPLCCKSLGDMSQYFERIDNMLESERMPDEYIGMKNLIFCSDCEKRSVADFHFVYHKCKPCGSYNTKVLEELGKQDENENIDTVMQETSINNSNVAASPQQPTESRGVIRRLTRSIYSSRSSETSNLTNISDSPSDATTIEN